MIERNKIHLWILSILSICTTMWTIIVNKTQRNKNIYRHTTDCDMLRLKKERDMQSEELFRRLEEVMIKDRLYANPNLERDSLCRILGTNPTYLTAAIKQRYRDLTILGYINSIRIDCAKKMLIKADKFDIEQVAVNSGFGSSRTLYRQFKSVLAITPLEFYKTSHKSKNKYQGNYIFVNWIYHFCQWLVSYFHYF